MIDPGEAKYWKGPTRMGDGLPFIFDLALIIFFVWSLVHAWRQR